MSDGHCSHKAFVRRVSSQEGLKMTLTTQIRKTEEVEGIYLRDVSFGEALLVRTMNSRYSIVYLGYGMARLRGNARICEDSRLANILGSTWGGNMLWVGFIGIGMCLQFQFPGDSRIATTTPIRSVVRLRKVESDRYSEPSVPRNRPEAR